MRSKSQRHQRRGVTMVWAVLVIIPVSGFLALAVDLGLVMTARSQCQNAADSAAMAGVRTLNGNPDDNYNVSGATPNALAAAMANTILGTDIEAGQVNVELGRYTYDDALERFDAQIPGPNGDPWTMVRTTVSYAGNFTFGRILGINVYNTAASAAAVHRPRDVCVIVDLSGSMRFDSLVGIPYTGDRTMSNNPETVYPQFGPYSDTSAAGLLNSNSSTTLGGQVYGSANVSVETSAGDAIVEDFYTDYAHTTSAFSPALDSYATTPGGDVPLTTNGNTTTTFARTAARIIYNNNTSTTRHNNWETNGYEEYVADFQGYTQGPRYWGKTFFVWPPDPRSDKDWRRLYFEYPGTNNPMDDNTQLFDTSGYFRDPDPNDYSINYSAILNFIKNVGPNPFPSSLRAGGIVYYTAIPDSFTTIDVNPTYPTFPSTPSTQTAKNERFWKDYIDYVLGCEQNSSGGSYTSRRDRVGYGDMFSWSTSSDPIRITGKPAAGSTYGNPPASMDYRDNPRRPKTHFWFGPMTLVDFLGNYNQGRYWWPGSCHESPTWQCKLGIQAAIVDIKNNHPNDNVALIFFSNPATSATSSGRFNRVRAPLGQDYDRLINSLWFPPYVLDNPGTEISPYDNGSAMNIREAPNASGGTCYAMPLMLAYNQFSSNPALRTYNDDDGAPVGDAGGLGRRGANKLLIFETDGVPNYSASADFASGDVGQSYYEVRAPDEFPSSGGVSESTAAQQAYDIIDRMAALEDDYTDGPGFSTQRKPVIVHCIGFGTLFEPSNAGSTQTSALSRLQEMQFRGGMAGGEQPDASTPLPAYKQIVGTSAERIDKLKEAFSNIMQDGVQVSLIE